MLCSSTLDAGSVGGLFCRSQRSMDARSYVWPVCDSNTGSSYRSHEIGHRRWSGGSGGGTRPALRTAYSSPPTNPRCGIVIWRVVDGIVRAEPRARRGVATIQR